MTSLYVNQLPDLMKHGVKRNRQFFKEMFDCDRFTESERWFDKLDCKQSFCRQADPEMTVESFSRLISSAPENRTYAVLQIGSPDPFDIRYALDIQESGIRKSSWFLLPHNDHNLEVLAELYERSFKRDLLQEPVQPGLRDYYEKRITQYANLNRWKTV